MHGALPPLTGRLVDAIVEAWKKQIDKEIMALTSNPTCKHVSDIKPGETRTVTVGVYICPWCEIERLQRRYDEMNRDWLDLLAQTTDTDVENRRLRTALERIVHRWKHPERMEGEDELESMAAERDELYAIASAAVAGAADETTPHHCRAMDLAVELSRYFDSWKETDLIVLSRHTDLCHLLHEVLPDWVDRSAEKTSDA